MIQAFQQTVYTVAILISKFFNRLLWCLASWTEKVESFSIVVWCLNQNCLPDRTHSGLKYSLKKCNLGKPYHSKIYISWKKFKWSYVLEWWRKLLLRKPLLISALDVTTLIIALFCCIRFWCITASINTEFHFKIT